MKRWALRLGALLLLGFALYGIADATHWKYALAGLAVVVLVMWPRSLPRVDVVLIQAIAATVVAAVAVVGINVLVNQVDGWIGDGESRLPILAGMGVAILVFAAIAYRYLRWVRWKRWQAGAGGVVLALAVIAGLPVLVGALEADHDEVPPPERVASQLDLLIVADGSRHGKPPPLPPHPLLPFDVSYSVGVAGDDGVGWTLANSTDAGAAADAIAAGDNLPAAAQAPIPRKGADSAVLLLVDGTPPVSLDPAGPAVAAAKPGEIPRWRRVAAAAAPPGTPVFAVLQARPDSARLERWQGSSWLQDAVSAQAQSQSVADTGVQLAVGSPTSQADFALAMAHRPVLLFDSAERFPLPLSIDALFRAGMVTLCHDGGLSSGCDEAPLRTAGELESGGTHLRLDLGRIEAERRQAVRESSPPPPPPGAPREGPGAPPPSFPPPGAGAPGGAGAPAGVGSMIYVHPVAVEREGRRLLYLDYWWYLPGNPVEIGGGALCGAGLVIPGVTCPSHESDWEGLTVVVDRTEAEPRLVAVHYAQHASVVRYLWGDLRKRWREPDVTPLLPPLADLAGRPLAFVAAGTHAGYPEPCAGCKQVAHDDRGEGPHRGDRGWAGNDTVVCGQTICLQPLPTRAGGSKPALWNAYDGQWGERHCRFRYYCDSGTPPTAPGNQGRYRDPTEYDLVRQPRPFRGARSE